MTEQEAYVQVRQMIDEINRLSTEAKKIASKHGLLMGTLRFAPTTFAVNKPDSMRPDPIDEEENFVSSSSHWDDSEEMEDFDDERFISSSVCW